MMPTDALPATPVPDCQSPQAAVSPVRWRWPRPFVFLLVMAGAAAVLALGLLPLALAIKGIDQSFLRRVGSPLRIPGLAERSTIYAADGSALGSVYLDYNRQDVPLWKINLTTRRAVLAIEDHAFYEHGPIYVPSIIRALILDLKAGAFVQGGSTIAQQLVKNTVTGDAVTLLRKITEAEDAIRLERTYTKNEILGMYLNQVYLGDGVYGFAAAAQYYFAETPAELTLPQSSLLAGMIAAPARFDPIVHPKAALARRNQVLQRMRVLGWITPVRYRRALSKPIRLSDKERDAATPGPSSYWTQYVVDSFLADPRFGKTYRARVRALYRGGLKIYTTLQPEFQREAEQAIKNRMTGPGLPQSAVVSIVPQTGAIEAMAVGNWPFGKYRYNLATDPGGGRTAGSAFKAFTLAAALEQGISPNAAYNGDSPRTIPDCGGGQTWTVHNAEPGSGNYPLWLATADSVNVVFAQVINQVGPDNVARVAHRMGITSPLTAVCPLTLGTSPVSPLEMTSGYSTLANGGVHCTPYAIARVVSSSGRTIMRARPQCQRAIPAAVAAEETTLLEGVVQFGTGTAANIGRPQAGKTGTGERFQDAWFMGYVPQLVTGVWVGYANAEVPMFDVPGYGPGFGGILAAPIWHDYMLAATHGLPLTSFPPPPPLVYPSPNPAPTPTPVPTPASIL